MTNSERDELKEAVKEAVHEQLPETLAELLGPMVARSTTAVFRKYRRFTVAACLVFGISIGLLFHDVGTVVNHNTSQNKIQDCILAGLIRGVETTDKDPRRNAVYNYALANLDQSSKCPRFSLPSNHSTYRGPH